MWDGANVIVLLYRAANETVSAIVIGYRLLVMGKVGREKRALRESLRQDARNCKCKG